MSQTDDSKHSFDSFGSSRHTVSPCNSRFREVLEGSKYRPSQNIEAMHPRPKSASFTILITYNPGDNFTGSRDIPITDIYHETTLLAACEKVNDVQTSRGIFGRRFIMQWSNRDGPTGAKIVMHQSDAETDRYDVIAKIQCENVGHEVVKEMRDLGLLAEEDSDDQ